MLCTNDFLRPSFLQLSTEGKALARPSLFLLEAVIEKRVSTLFSKETADTALRLENSSSSHFALETACNKGCRSSVVLSQSMTLNRIATIALGRTSMLTIVMWLVSDLVKC